jgi:hypothetical protein
MAIISLIEIVSHATKVAKLAQELKTINVQVAK